MNKSNTTSKRWFSLYNNIYPGRLWPSSKAILFILISMFFITQSNNKKNSFEILINPPSSGSFSSLRFNEIHAVSYNQAITKP